MTYLDDSLVYFLLTRNAYNFKRIDRTFYLVLKGWSKKNKKIKFRLKEKYKKFKYNRCNSYLSFIEFILYKTKDISFHKML